MKTALEIALQLERKIADKLQTNLNCHGEKYTYWATALRCQQELLSIINLAQLQPESFPEYPDIDEELIIGSNDIWQQSATHIDTYEPTQLLELIICADLHNTLSNFYTQAAANIAHPLSKIFLQSLSEIKKLQSLKMDMLKRTQQNLLWGQLGYSPFSKD